MRRTLILFALLATAACAGSRKPESTLNLCRADLFGVVVTTWDTADGIVITFAADQDDAPRLRDRVAEVAHSLAPSEAPGARVPAAEATLEEIPIGVRLVLRAVDPADVERLQERAREHAYELNGDRCPYPAETRLSNCCSVSLGRRTGCESRTSTSGGSVAYASLRVFDRAGDSSGALRALRSSEGSVDTECVVLISVS